MSFLLLLLIFSAGIYLLYKSNTDGITRLLSFGIFWFFLTLSVESTLIPLQVIFEHRVYLPSMGLIVTVVSGAFLILKKWAHKLRPASVQLFILIIFMLAASTYSRNDLWRDKVRMWEDVAAKSPFSARVQNNLGNAYYGEGMADKAMIHYMISAKLSPDYAEAHNNLATLYLEKGQNDKALEHFEVALRLRPDLPIIQSNIGYVYAITGRPDEAIKHIKTALRMRPDFSDAYVYLGVAYYHKGMIDEAMDQIQTALELEPDNEDAYVELGKIYLETGATDKAIKEFKRTLQIDPDNNEAREYLDRINKTQSR
jgi:tetratricopeptide (TPR) repeat protein